MAAFLTGKMVVGQPGDIHSSALNPVLTECDGIDEFGQAARYVYLAGVASTAQYDWVAYDEAGATIRAIADGQGDLAIATAATVANKYGWYQIVGKAYANALTGFADNGKVYLTGTAGSVDDSDVAGDAVVGAWGRSALDATGCPTGTAIFQLDRPKIHDLAFD
jgi:hypothetical protein